MATGETLLLNIIGGIIAAIAYSTILLLKKYFRKRKFKYLLGMDADKDRLINLVYAKLGLPEVFDKKGNVVTHPYIKPNYRSNQMQYSFSIEFPVSSCEVRALKYLTSSLFNHISVTTELVGDVDKNINSKLDMSFISLGGPASNYKTEDVLQYKTNKFLTMDTDNFISKTGKKLLKGIEIGYDYGLILRLRPIDFKERVWVVCSGIGEWGTSGTAWFLSHKYNELLKEIKSGWNFFYWGRGKDFAAIIKVKQGQDESASLFKVFKSESDIEKFIPPNINIVTNKSQLQSPIHALGPGTSSMNPAIPTDSSTVSGSHILPSGIQTDMNQEDDEDKKD